MANDVARWVQEARDGDLEAYGALIKRFQDAVYGSALARLGNWHDAEEAAQDAFLEAWRKLGDLREPGKFPGWLRRITISCCSRFLRKARRSVGLEGADETPSRGASPVAQAERRELKDRVLEALKSLSEPLREATTLFYINGYSHKEIGRFLNVPIGTVKRRLHDSREQLKETMMTLAEDELKAHRPSEEFTNAVIRLATSENDLRTAARYIAYSARHHPEIFKSGAGGDARVVVAGGKERLDTAAWYSPVQMSIGGTLLQGVRIGEVADEGGDVGSPQFIAGTLAAFEYAKREGEFLAIAHGDHYNHPRCGYVPCFYHPRATLRTERALSLESQAKVRKLRKGERADAERTLLADPSASKLGGWFVGPKHVVEEDGEVSGYFGYQATDGKWAPKVWVSGITMSSEEAARAMLRFLAERSKEAGEENIYLFESPLTVAGRTVMELGGTCEVRGTWHQVGEDEEHVAILDLLKLSRALKREFQARLKAAGRLSGAFSLQMEDEVVSFKVAEGKVTLGSKKQRAHLKLPRWIVTRTYMAYYSGEDALQRVGVGLSARARRLFCALFPSLWPCSIPDFNFWFPEREWRDHPAKKRREIESIHWPWLE